MSRHLNTRQNNNIKIHIFSQHIFRVLYIKENDLVGTCDTHGKVRKSYKYFFIIVEKTVALWWTQIDVRLGEDINIQKYWKGNLKKNLSFDDQDGIGSDSLLV